MNIQETWTLWRILHLFALVVKSRGLYRSAIIPSCTFHPSRSPGTHSEIEKGLILAHGECVCQGVAVNHFNGFTSQSLLRDSPFSDCHSPARLIFGSKTVCCQVQADRCLASNVQSFTAEQDLCSLAKIKINPARLCKDSIFLPALRTWDSSQTQSCLHNVVSNTVTKPKEKPPTWYFVEQLPHAFLLKYCIHFFSLISIFSAFAMLLY